MLAVLAVAVACAVPVPRASALTDPVVAARFAEIRQPSGLTMPIALCRMPARGNPRAASKMELGGGRAFVYVSERALARYSPAALDALMAHELAHLVLMKESDWEAMFWRQPTMSEYLTRETTADALGAKWVGREAFGEVFREVLADHGHIGPNGILEMTYRDLKLKYW
jgi:Zn-dependent protease with chaperone function